MSPRDPLGLALWALVAGASVGQARLAVPGGQLRRQQVRLPRPEAPRRMARGCDDTETECLKQSGACQEPTCRTGVTERPSLGQCMCAVGRVRNLISGRFVAKSILSLFVHVQ